ncbi:MAG: zinc dependent phospholipase C family protein [Erysipelotrichaceae bacterium]
MPNIATHGLMAHDVLQDIDLAYLSPLISQYNQVYALGSSGPDFLFYYHVLPWQNIDYKDDVFTLGNQIHNSKVNAFFQSALRVIDEEKDQTMRDIMVVFLAGQLMHWSLDSLGHPYVFYFTGEIANETQYWHFRFESMLDTIMVKQVKQLKLEDLKHYQFVESNQITRKAIAKLYHWVAIEVFDIDISEEVLAESLLSAAQIAKVLYDPYTLKIPVAFGIEKLSKQAWKYTGHMVTGTIDTQHDVLNLKHETWLHPCDATITSNDSFLDIYAKSIERGRACLYSLEAILTKQQLPLTLNAILMDRTYDTGLANPEPMVNFKPIYSE